jgi:hypothetical protein
MADSFSLVWMPLFVIHPSADEYGFAFKITFLRKLPVKHFDAIDALPCIDLVRGPTLPI